MQVGKICGVRFVWFGFPQKDWKMFMVSARVFYQWSKFEGLKKWGLFKTCCIKLKRKKLNK